MSKIADMQLGQLIKDTGDFGRFQAVMIGITTFIVITVNWSMMTMAYTGAVPDYQCVVYTVNGNASVKNVCDVNGTSCDVIVFDSDMRTAVSEWELVCDKKWITQSITTIQMTGLLFGGLFFGHLSDFIGRKPLFFLSLFMVGVFNAVSYFSVNWEMFAAMRFLIGMSCTAMSASNLGFEFIRNKWRIYLYLLPSWALWSAMMAVFCWRVHDWRYIHVVIAAVSFASLPLWFFFPESFRWQMAHGKVKEAEQTITFLAKFNGRPVPDLGRLKDMVKSETEKGRKTDRLYTVIDLFRTRQVRKVTLIFSLVWLFSSFSYYGIAFNVQGLSGDYYMNMFLLSLVDFPGSILLVIMNIWGGRKWTCVGFFVLGGLFALSYGILKYFDVEMPGMTLNLLALASKLTVSAAWEINGTWSAESFPTVVRNIGGGFVSSIARLGSMAAPQIITLGRDIPGLLYTVSGIVCLISSVCCVFLEETKNKDLTDTIQEDTPSIVPYDTLNNTVQIEQVNIVTDSVDGEKQ